MSCHDSRLPRMVLRLTLALLLSALSLPADAQSFASLRRSYGKSSVYSAVEKSLAENKVSGDVCQMIKTGDIEAPYGGKTPIYLVMDYIATHKKTECQAAEELLSCFAACKGFDVNSRYSDLMTPLAYLIRANYEYLGGHFSSEYISDNVLRMLIDAGARVNTYGENGSTLMAFAQETGNRSLQDYLVTQGINLRHEDKEGVDDVYKLIAEGNLPIVKRALEEGKVKLDINTLKNEPSEFVQYADLYDYLGQHCAKQASTYEDIVKFRKRFSKLNALVQQKYENLSRQETSAASDFHAIQKVRERYPDLEKITAPKRLIIYREHVKLVDVAYKNAQAAAIAVNPSYSHSEDRTNLKDFVLYYKTTTQYDPDNRMTIAGQALDFLLVCHALTDGFGKYYYSGGRVRPYWTGSGADTGMLSTAESILDPDNKYGFGEFYKQVAPRLAQRRVEQREHEAWQKELLASAQSRYDAEEAARQARIAAEMAQERQKRERERSIAKDPDVELSSIGITYETSKWETHFELGDIIFPKKDYEKDHYMEVKYSDGTKGVIISEPGESAYLPSGGINFLAPNNRYTTLSDAIAAEYFFTKYGSKRYKGLK